MFSGFDTLDSNSSAPLESQAGLFLTYPFLTDQLPPEEKLVKRYAGDGPAQKGWDFPMELNMGACLRSALRNSGRWK